LKRAKRRGLARNAAVALGNQGDPQDIQTLSRALTEDPEPLVRAHAAWALGRMGVESGRVALIEAQERELEPAVLQEIEAALGPHP
jgi:epoxyqueuosine reductase